MTGLKLSRLF